MVFKKNTPEALDLLQEKQNRIAQLSRQASDAVDVVTRTMNSLEEINQQIDCDLDEIDAYINNLNVARNAMYLQRKNNTSIIANFSKLLDTSST